MRGGSKWMMGNFVWEVKEVHMILLRIQENAKQVQTFQAKKFRICTLGRSRFLRPTVLYENVWRYKKFYWRCKRVQKSKNFWGQKIGNFPLGIGPTNESKNIGFSFFFLMASYWRLTLPLQPFHLDWNRRKPFHD